VRLILGSYGLGLCRVSLSWRLELRRGMRRMAFWADRTENEDLGLRLGSGKAELALRDWLW
jgi:hypothetical protein